MSVESIDTAYDFKINLTHLKQRIVETNNIINSTIKSYSMAPILSDDNTNFVDFGNYKIIKNRLNCKTEVSWVKFKRYHVISRELSIDQKAKISILSGSVIDNIYNEKYSNNSSLFIGRREKYNLTFSINSIILFDIKGISTESFLG